MPYVSGTKNSRSIGKRRLTVEQARAALLILTTFLGKPRYNELVLSKKKEGEEKSRKTGYRTLKFASYNELVQQASAVLQANEIGHYLNESRFRAGVLRILAPSKFSVRAEYKKLPLSEIMDAHWALVDEIMAKEKAESERRAALRASMQPDSSAYTEQVRRDMKLGKVSSAT